MHNQKLKKRGNVRDRTNKIDEEHALSKSAIISFTIYPIAK
jgi:hypothetical protein